MIRKNLTTLKRAIFSGLMMSLCAFVINPSAPVKASMRQETEPNNDWATANNLSLNTWIKGTIGLKSDDWHYNDEDFYKFTISQVGETYVEIKPDDTNTANSTWNIQLFDADKNELCQWVNCHTLKSAKTGWMPGTYYLKVKKYSGSDTDNAYNLIVHNTPSSQWEKDQYYLNKNPSNANIVSINKAYTGSLYSSRDVDYYRLKLKGTNGITFKFSIDDTVANPGVWNITFREQKTNNQFFTRYVSANQTITIPRCSGDLLIIISSYSSTEGDTYHFTTSCKLAVTEITSAKKNNNKVALRWKKVSNATGYYIYRSTSENGTYKKIKTVTGKTSYTDSKSIKRGTMYFYKIIAFRKTGSKIQKSGSSNIKNTTYY